MREADKSYLWCTEAWFRTKPGTTSRSKTIHTTQVISLGRKIMVSLGEFPH